MDETPALASITTLISGIQSAVTWIYGLFSTIVTTIATNDLLLYPVLLALTISAVYLVIRIVRKFGLRGRRG